MDWHDASIDTESRDPLEVLTMVAHDMRTPLTALLQALRVIQSGRAGTVGATQERFLRIALQNSESLLQLVSRVHEAGRLDCGAAPARFALHDAWTPARAIVESLAEHAESRGIQLELDPDGGDAATPAAWADADMVGQLLLNLVGNALKFTPRGGRVTVAARPSGLEPGWIEYAVRDNGPGIPPEELSRVFEKFYQVKPLAQDLARRPDGAGLGLAICRGIARAHGGAIGARNNDGRGCTFWAVVPAFGSGRGATTQVDHALREARRRSVRVSLIAVEAEAGATAHVVHGLAALKAGTVVDMGAGCFGVAVTGAPGSDDVQRALAGAAALASSAGCTSVRTSCARDAGDSTAEEMVGEARRGLREAQLHRAQATTHSSFTT